MSRGVPGSHPGVRARTLAGNGQESDVDNLCDRNLVSALAARTSAKSILATASPHPLAKLSRGCLEAVKVLQSMGQTTSLLYVSLERRPGSRFIAHHIFSKSQPASKFCLANQSCAELATRGLSRGASTCEHKIYRSDFPL